jgi:hypothetical protein
MPNSVRTKFGAMRQGQRKIKKAYSPFTFLHT